MARYDAPIGQQVSTQGSRVVGLVSCVPSRVVGNDHFEALFGADSVADVVKMIGVQERRWVGDGVSTADLCQTAANRLLIGLGWTADDVDALIFVSQTPDFMLPATACALHGRLELRRGAIAFDINLGCSGYPYALWLAQTMIQSGAARRVLVAVGDTISRIVDSTDRATAMLFGDAGTVTALEACDLDDPSATSHFVLGTDGRGESHLIVPQGPFKRRDGQLDSRLAGRDPACLYMDGGEIFNFTLAVVPHLLANTLSGAGKTLDDYDAFLFHQANSFMLKHLAKKMKLPESRVPSNIARFGNTSSASIPLLITSELAPLLQTQGLQLALFGFGVGFSWASMSMKLGPLRVVETIES